MFGKKTVFGKKRVSVAEAMGAIKGALADADAARDSAQQHAQRALAAAQNTELKAIKAAAKEQTKVDKKAEQTAQATHKADLKSAKAIGKQARKDDKSAAALAEKVAKKTPQSIFQRATDPKAAKRAITAAKVIGPVLAPFALKAATSTRDYLDNRKANRLGVTAAEVGSYRGPTGKVEARLSGLQRSVAELRSRRTSDLQVTRFADVAAGRITDLTTAARAAASMPPGRRRATVAAVNQELDQIDADLMTFLVGH